MPLLLVTIAFVFILFVMNGVGDSVLRLLRVGDPAPDLRLGLSLSLGFGVVCNLVALTGLFLGWRPWLWFLIAALVLWAATNVSALRHLARVRTLVAEWWSEATWIERGIVSIAWLSLVALVVRMVLPPTETDSVRSYLRDAQVLLVAGHLRSLPEAKFTYFPMNRQMLSVIGFLMWGYPLALVFSLAIAATAGVLVVALGRRVLSLRAAMLAVPLMLLMPAVQSLAISGKDDLLVACFLLAGIVVFVAPPVELEQTPAFLLSGAFFGLALGSKPTALLAVVAPILFGALAIFRRRGTGSAPNRSVAATVSGVAGAVLGFLPWFVWSWIDFGGPLRSFTDNPARRYVAPVGLSSALDGLWRRIGESVLAIPLQVVRHEIPVLFVALLAVGLIVCRRRFHAWTVFIASFAVLATYTFFSFLSPYLIDSRFSLVAPLMLAVVAGAGLLALAQRENAWLRFGLALPVAVWIGVTLLWGNRIGARSLAINIGLKSPESYVDRYFGSEPAVLRFADSTWSWNDRVWSVNVPDLMYYRTHMYYTASSLLGLRLRSLDDVDAECAALDSAGIGWVLKGPSDSAAQPDKYPIMGPGFEQLADRCLDTAYVTPDREYVVFRVRHGAASHGTTADRQGVAATTSDTR